MAREITEGIKFGDIFDSITEGLYLIERNADSPDEKEVTLSVPYLQGEHDYSMLLGERVFHSRKIKYTFGAFNLPYNDRKKIENSMKRRLLAIGYDQIVDTHDADGFWWGKCSEINVDDDEQYRQIFITVTFTCYPYLLSNLTYFDDVWDTFNFDYDVSCFSAYDVRYYFEIPFINNGSTSVSPTFYSDSEMTVQLNEDAEILLPGGIVNDYYAKVARGVNTLKIWGYGKFAIYMRKEYMN